MKKSEQNEGPRKSGGISMNSLCVDPDDEPIRDDPEAEAARQRRLNELDDPMWGTKWGGK